MPNNCLRTSAALAVLAAAGTLALSGPVTPALAAKAPSATVGQVQPGGHPNSQGGLDANNAIRAGNNVGTIIKSWGAALLLGVAGFMGLAALHKRNVGEGLTLLALVVLVGGFIFADGAVNTFVQSLWGAFGLGN